MKKEKETWSLAKRSIVCFIIVTLLSILSISLLLVGELRKGHNLRNGHLITGIIFFLVLGIVVLAYHKCVIKPFKVTTRIMKLFNYGYDNDGIFKSPYDLSKEMKNTFKKMEELIDRNYAIKASEKQAEYLALQNQINPHFLYNTLEAIRGEALSEGMTSIADMTEALATFFRYSISKVETLVTLEDEIRNLENYFVIQQYRFGNRLNLSIHYDDEDMDGVFEYYMPKLTLQPIIENAIYHGLECKVGMGNISLNIETTQSRLIINIIDDGVGIDEETLEKLNSKLKCSFEVEEVKKGGKRKGGIALINVNNRIKLLFGEQYGITISSIVNIGTEVEITIPLVKDGNMAGSL